MVHFVPVRLVLHAGLLLGPPPDRELDVAGDGEALGFHRDPAELLERLHAASLSAARPHVLNRHELHALVENLTLPRLEVAA
jgi:hypothetical protein